MYFLCRSTPRARCASSRLPPNPSYPSPRVHAHARTHVRVYTRAVAHACRIPASRGPASVCSCFIMCNTHYTNPCAAQPSPRHLSSDLDKSRIAVAEVRPRIPHLSPFHFRESRAAKSRRCRVVALRGVAQFKSSGRDQGDVRGGVGQYTTRHSNEETRSTPYPLNTSLSP